MPLKIIKDRETGARRVVCEPTPTPIGTNLPPPIRASQEVYPEMQKIQDMLTSKKHRAAFGSAR